MHAEKIKITSAHLFSKRLLTFKGFWSHKALSFNCQYRTVHTVENLLYQLPSQTTHASEESQCSNQTLRFRYCQEQEASLPPVRGNIVSITVDGISMNGVISTGGTLTRFRLIGPAPFANLRLVDSILVRILPAIDLHIL